MLDLIIAHDGVVLNPPRSPHSLRDMDRQNLCMPSKMFWFQPQSWLTAMPQLFLAFLNLSPWLLAILYDLVLWISRCIWYEIPIYGGRAQGNTRPRAPSLRETSRRMSLAEIIAGGHSRTESQETLAQLRRRDHRRKESNNALEQE